MGKLKKVGPNNAKLPDWKTFLEAGIDPKTRLPIKLAGMPDFNLKDDVRRFIETIDTQDYVNRGVWYNLPRGIDSQELERMMYLKGQLAFFYVKEDNKFYFMPFALDGGLDFYQRFKRIHPVPLNDSTPTDTEEDRKAYSNLKSLLAEMKRTCIYDVLSEEEIIEDDIDVENCCVILRDYTPKYSQYCIPRMILQRPLIEQEADFFCYTRTAGLIALAIKAMRVNDADQENEVTVASEKYKDMALRGIPWMAITSTVEFQDLATSTGVKPDEFLMILQSFDNLRLRGLGVDNGGLFQKRAQELKDQAMLNGGPIGLEAQDGTTKRQYFCMVANALFGLSMWYEPSENILMSDRNMDGAIYDDKASEMADTTYDNTSQEE